MSSQNKLIWLSHLIYQPHRDQITEPQMCTVENCLSLEVCRGFVQQQDDKISLVSLFSFNDLSFVVRKVICQQLFVFFFKSISIKWQNTVCVTRQHHLQNWRESYIVHGRTLVSAVEHQKLIDPKYFIMAFKPLSLFAFFVIILLPLGRYCYSFIIIL